MNDRELLELSAHPAGIRALCDPNGVLRDCTGMHPMMNLLTAPVWNPLKDDGQALRLAVKLLFEIDMGRGSIAIRHATGIKVLEDFNNDPFAATRRAIVRAAAEIAKSKP